jgi:hypothetical protein
MRTALEAVGLLVAPTTALTALLYYFGWVRTAAAFGYFGVDQSTLQLSTSDYLLRSADIAFRPFAALLLVLASWTGLYVALRADRPPDRLRLLRLLRRRVRAGLPWCAAVLIGLPVLDLFVVPVPFLSPLAAAVLLGAGALLAELTLRPNMGGRPARRIPAGIDSLLRLVLAATVFLALFWSTAIYATRSGHALAAGIAARPASRPGVVLYCRLRPEVTGPGVTLTLLSGEDLAYGYRYDGLVLLAHPGSTWLLLPVDWTPDDAVIRLSDDQVCRLDFRPPR